MSDLVLPVRGEAAVLFADLLHQTLHERLLPHQIEAAQDLPRLLDELSKAVLVRVARVKKGWEDLFLALVVEVLSRRELFLRVTGTADDDPLEVPLVQERFRHQVADLLVPLVARDVVAPLQTPGALPPHPVLARDRRLHVLALVVPL